MHTIGSELALAHVAACTSLRDKNASSGSACRGLRTPPLSARLMIHWASSRAMAPDERTDSISPPPCVSHLHRSRIGTLRAGGWCGGSHAATNSFRSTVPSPLMSKRRKTVSASSLPMVEQPATADVIQATNSSREIWPSPLMSKS
eukprot:scaffold229980_cov32-Tisochrysis_lutea.AAC.1